MIGKSGMTDWLNTAAGSTFNAVYGKYSITRIANPLPGVHLTYLSGYIIIITRIRCPHILLKNFSGGY
jgi:hypothetical protein